MQVQIYHNPRCSKSRSTLEIINQQGIEPIVTNYLETPPNYDQLNHILSALNMQPRELMRRNENEFADNNLDDPELSRDELIAAMIKFPKLIERPIVLVGDKVTIGRPPESVLDILPK
jgi:arsenate reductase